jgi:hypothetical protein
LYIPFYNSFFFSPLNTALSSSANIVFKEVKAPDKRPYSIEAEIPRAPVSLSVYSHHEEESRYIGNKD